MENFQVERLNSNEQEVFQKLFLQVQKSLVEEVGQLAFKSWLSLLKISELKNGTLYLSLPSHFLYDWVVPHYGNKIDIICRKTFKGIKKIKIIVNTKLKSEDINLKDFSSITSKASFYDRQPSSLDPRFNLKPWLEPD